MRVKILVCLLLSNILLSGCAGVAMESARITRDTSSRNSHMQAALNGDPEAQYQVGKSYCCAPRNDVDGFYNNQKATEFLCLAARQGHAMAAYEIGKIYSGDTIDGIRLIRRAATAVRGDDLENHEVAYYWFSQALQNGYSEAFKEMASLGLQDTSPFTDPAVAPCTLSEVFKQ